MQQLAFALARRTDPATSHRAAERTTKFRAKHEAAIFAAIADAGSHGATMHEIAEATGLEPVQVGRRLCAMGRRGVIERRIVPAFDAEIGDYEQRGGCAIWRATA